MDKDNNDDGDDVSTSQGQCGIKILGGDPAPRMAYALVDCGGRFPGTGRLGPMTGSGNRK